METTLIGLIVLLGIIFLIILFSPDKMRQLEILMEEEANRGEKEIMLSELSTQDDKAEVVGNVLKRLRTKGLIDFKGEPEDLLKRINYNDITKS